MTQDIIIRNVPAWGNAGQLLRERGIEWDSALTFPIEIGGMYYRRKYMGVHVYFMKDGRDVAYFTFGLDCLHINATPRVWCPTLLAKMESAYQF